VAALLQRNNTATVVIIDDTDDVRLLVRLALEGGGGFQVVGEADNGLSGIEEVERAQPDLVMLDLRMPVMSGLEALPRIKRACPSARVVVLSGFEADVMAEHALRAGADGYAQKGMSTGDLAEYVSGVLDRSGAPEPPGLPTSIPRQGR